MMMVMMMTKTISKMAKTTTKKFLKDEYGHIPKGVTKKIPHMGH